MRIDRSYVLLEASQTVAEGLDLVRRQPRAGKEDTRTEEHRAPQVRSPVELPMAVNCSAVLRRFELLPQRRP